MKTRESALLEEETGQKCRNLDPREIGLLPNYRKSRTLLRNAEFKGANSEIEKSRDTII